MSYVGNTPTSQSFTSGTDTFSGTGSQTAFTLSRSVNSVNDILVVVNNVDQQPSAYTISGTTLTMSDAPSSGTNNVYVRYLSTTQQTVAPSQGSVSPNKLTTGGPSWDASGNLSVPGNASATGGVSGTTGSFSGNMSFNSGYGSAAVAYGCRAWVNFNGTGTVAIRSSANVTSITDGGVGIYTVNLTSAMPDANYAVTYGVVPDAGFSSGSSAARMTFLISQTTTSFVIHTGYQANGSTAGVGFLDYSTICASIFR